MRVVKNGVKELFLAVGLDAMVTDSVLEKRICVAAVRSGFCHVVADHRLRSLDDGVVLRGSVSDSTYIYVYMYICIYIYMHAREPKNEKHVRGRLKPFAY